MNSKTSIEQLGKRFTLYAGLAAISLMAAIYLLIWFVDGRPFIAKYDPLLLLVFFSPAIAAYISAFLCWRMFMKKGVSNKKSKSAGRWAAFFAYPILGALWGIAGQFSGHEIDISERLITFALSIGFISFYGLMFTGLVTIPIGHWIGARIVPADPNEKLAAYRAEKWGQADGLDLPKHWPYKDEA